MSTPLSPHAARVPRQAVPPAGFTLIELIVVMVLIGILAVFVVPIILEPFEAFRDTERRARLVAESEQALLRVMREVRHALPNSVRLNGDKAVEFLNTVDGGRYRRYQDLSSLPPSGDVLSIPGTDTSFDVLSNLNGNVAGQHLIIYNTDSTADVPTNAYRGGNRTQATGLSGGVLNFSSKVFPAHSPNQRFDLVDGPVIFECVSAGSRSYQLKRCSGYNIQANQPAVGNCPGTSELLLDDLDECTLKYAPGASSRAGVLTLTIKRTLLDDHGNQESIPLVAQAQVWNVP